jgi:drug/metabolite transporter (DMT)-like permease
MAPACALPIATRSMPQMSQQDRQPPSNISTAALIALASAALFGASTPMAKMLIGTIDPWMLAALLYLGSGIGLAVVRAGLRLSRASATPAEAPLTGAGWLWFGGAILAGGVVGPVLLMTGLTRTPAASASLLLNLEGMLTALLAWFVFRENFDRRIALGMIAIAAGASVLSWQGTLSFDRLAGPLAIIGACLAWAVDNNLTRRVSLNDPVQIAMLKGLIAGSVNLVLALSLGAPLPAAGALLGAAMVGLLGYGVSLVLFVIALRHLGTARTGAYYSTAPFVGALIAVVALGEPVNLQLIVAGVLMGIGVWLHLTERHEHEHEHAPIEHEHSHRHDEHHRHAHRAADPPGGPHTHRRVHVALRHRHPHYPDAHHRHGHQARSSAASAPEPRNN